MFIHVCQRQRYSESILMFLIIYQYIYSLHEDSFIGSQKAPPSPSSVCKPAKKPRPLASYNDFVAGVKSHIQNLQGE